MRELLLYAEEKKKQRAAEHRLRHAHSGRCSGLTDKEYMRYRVNGKKTYSKARKFTHNRMWRDHTKKFTTEQLKQIKTL